MWFGWKQEINFHPSFISGFVYRDDRVYWLDMVGIHVFDLEDEGYEVINRDIHGQDETTFDLLTLQAHFRLKQINLNLETMTIMEEKIDSLGGHLHI
ncbi:hypothetical protein RHGRI_009826 [Rhododendron griersonianum]|uniref:Uncharacterized protein n=1 Tax=Rhododendron griersonianum TaxID=479676 RepID=A0AAV6KGA5_9ERIC|nr:hypothetical protein RHGRI_009826 [Rhododendron griersonianum]